MKLGATFLALAIVGSAVAAPTADLRARPTRAKRSKIFEWFGANESGAEFGQGAYPGVLDRDYVFPNTTAIDTLMNLGMNIFRVTFSMERMIPTNLTGPLNQTYFQPYANVVNHITANGGYAVIDPHNYGRYYGNIINSTFEFAAFWRTVASQFKFNPHVIFDTNNEYFGMNESHVVALNQAAINAIRGVGAGSQYIFAEGNSWTGAWTWPTINDDMKYLFDPSHKLVYEMHQYLDSDGSGTSDVCVNSTIGAERITAATAWLKANHKVAILGEFAGGDNAVCRDAVSGMLSLMANNTDVWKGGMWWAAGPWWGNYIFSIEPPTGIAYTDMLSTLQTFF